MPSAQNEAFARILIDKALQDSLWNLLDPRQVRLEVSGNGGRADYVLSGPQGPLCVLEAKKQDDDPYDAKEQARGYAENLRAPFVILSNGAEHWFWNLQRADVEDAYRIERLPSPADLEYLRLKHLNPPRPLMTEVLGPDYIRRFRPDLKLRGYQIRAIDAVGTRYDQQGKRKSLVDSGAVYSVVEALFVRAPGCKPHRRKSFFLADGTAIERRIGYAYFEYGGIGGAAPVIFCEKGDPPSADSARRRWRHWNWCWTRSSASFAP